MTGQLLHQQRRQDQCPVFKIDRQGRFVYIDSRTEKLLGVSAEELFGKNIEEFLDKESFDSLRHILESGRSCETFHYPLNANIYDISGKVHSYSVVVSQNFVAGNPANYQLILVPGGQSSDRQEAYVADEHKKDIFAQLARDVVEDENMDFNRIAETIVTNENILNVEIYSLNKGQTELVASATRRPYSGADKTPDKLSGEIIESLIIGNSISQQAKTAADDSLTSGEALVESILPLRRDRRTIGIMRLIHEPSQGRDISVPDKLARFLGPLLPVTEISDLREYKTGVDDTVVRAVIEGAAPYVHKINENLGHISGQFAKEITGYGREYLDQIKDSNNELKVFLDRFAKCYFAESVDQSAYQKIDLNRVLRDGYQRLSLKYPGVNVFLKNISLPIVHTDDAKIQEIFECILSNSFRYHDRASTLEIEVISRSTKEELTLSLADNGPGIPAEYAEDIFKPFWVVPNPAHNIAQGPGMGMAIARTQARSLGGDIRLGTTNRPGTVIEIILPNL